MANALTIWLDTQRSDWGRLRLLHCPAKPRATRAPVLLLHHPLASASQFNIPINGESWLEHFAGRGRDAWALDMPGFGASPLPCYELPAESALPATRSLETRIAVAAAFDHIGEPVVLVGHSWGGTVAALSALTSPTRVRSLVLVASPHLPEVPGFQPRALRGAWHDVPLDRILHILERERPDADKTVRRDTTVFDCLLDTLEAEAPNRSLRRRTLRLPTGPFVDFNLMLSGIPIFDPGRIQSPTLVVHGGDDRLATSEDQRSLFYRVGFPDKRYKRVRHGTQFLPLEGAARQLFLAVDTFIDEFG